MLYYTKNNKYQQYVKGVTMNVQKKAIVCRTCDDRQWLISYAGARLSMSKIT
jgi:hypothetical protein